jgi:hypothetical protein
MAQVAGPEAVHGFRLGIATAPAAVARRRGGVLLCGRGAAAVVSGNLMARVPMLLCLLLIAMTASAGSSKPKVEPVVDEAGAAQAAAAGSQVAELAQLCGWEADPALVLQAKTTALMLATQSIQPDKRRFEAMTRVLASDAMAGHVHAARRQVGNGGCVDEAEKSKWTSLRKHTLTLLATPPPPTRAPAGAPAAPPPAPPAGAAPTPQRL